LRILLLDIELAPNLAFTWGLYQQNVAINQLVQPHYMLCWAAKWLGEDEIFFASKHNTKTKKMLGPLHALLEEADAVIHYNGRRFDIPHINREFLLHDFTPPSPYKQIDLLETVKFRFKFASNKLQHVAQELGVGEKHKHDGFELWVKCLANDPEAWKTMQKYNIQDVLLLEAVYNKVQPWVKNHANHSLHNPDKQVCPHCGGEHLQKRGVYHTLSSVFQRYRCKTCGAWSKDNKVLNRKQYKTTGIV
jgi:hypothetical protein